MEKRIREKVLNGNFCDYNKNIMLKYLGSDFCTNSSKESCISAICDFLSNCADQPFNLWGFEMVEAFFRQGLWKKSRAQLFKTVISELLSMSNSSLELKEVPFFEVERFEKYFYNFKSLDRHIKNTVYRLEKEVVKDRESITKYSNIIVSMYLSWIGFTVSEIVKLRREDVNFNSKTISYQGKICSFLNYKPIDDYLSLFIPAEEYLILWQDKQQTRYFKGSELLLKQLKQSKTGGSISKTTLSNNTREYSGANLDNIYYSGLLDKLYLYEINGGIVERNCFKEIGEALNISVSEVYGDKSAFASLLSDYKIYRKKRMECFQ